MLTVVAATVTLAAILAIALWTDQALLATLVLVVLILGIAIALYGAHHMVKPLQRLCEQAARIGRLVDDEDHSPW